MFQLKHWFLIAAIVLIQSCGPSGDKTGSLPSSEGPKFHQVQKSLSEEIEKYELECEGTNCPKNIGMLVSQQDKLRWRCTAFFIDDDIMATAAHCLPKNLKTPGKKCQNLVYVLLAGEKEPLGCEEIRQVEQFSSGEFDYAFFKVDRHQKLVYPVSIQRQGRYDKQKIKILKVDPLEGDPYKGRIGQTECQLNSTSMISLFFNGPKTPQIQYSGCKTVSGNSGAPIMNLKSQVIGIHHSSTKPSSATSIALSQQTSKGRVDEFGAGTNFGCLCPIKDSYKRCLFYKSCSSQNNSDYLLSSRQQNLDRLSAGNQKVHGLKQLMSSQQDPQIDKYFSWSTQIFFEEVKDKKGELSELKMFSSYRPVCLKNEWKFKDLPIRQNKLSYQDITFCELDYTLDSSLRLKSIANSATSKCRQVKVDFELENPNRLVVRPNYKTQHALFSMERIIPYCN